MCLAEQWIFRLPGFHVVWGKGHEMGVVTQLLLLVLSTSISDLPPVAFLLVKSLCIGQAKGSSSSLVYLTAVATPGINPATAAK